MNYHYFPQTDFSIVDPLMYHYANSAYNSCIFNPEHGFSVKAEQNCDQNLKLDPGNYVFYQKMEQPYVKCEQLMGVSTQSDKTSPPCESNIKFEHDPTFIKFQNLEDIEIPAKKKESTIFKNAYLSFLVNKILNFVKNPCQNRYWVPYIFNKFGIIDQEQKNHFYAYAEIMSKRIRNQVSIQKVREFWLGPYQNNIEDQSDIQEKKKFHEIFRILSKIYLQKLFGHLIMRSKKVKKSTREFQLKMRRCLLKNLKNPADFKSYKDF